MCSDAVSAYFVDILTFCAGDRIILEPTIICNGIIYLSDRNKGITCHSLYSFLGILCIRMSAWHNQWYPTHSHLSSSSAKPTAKPSSKPSVSSTFPCTLCISYCRLKVRLSLILYFSLLFVAFLGEYTSLWNGGAINWSQSGAITHGKPVFFVNSHLVYLCGTFT